MDLLESFLLENGAQLNPTINDVQKSGLPDYKKTSADFMIILNEYELNTQRLHHSKSIREFWEGNKNFYPELYEVAKIYLTIPPTQSTVERSFSTLSFIYSNRRSSLAQNLLENMVLVKLNYDLAAQIFNEELDEIGI